MDLEIATTSQIVNELGRRRHPFVLIDLHPKTDLANQLVVGNLTLTDGAMLLSRACDYVLDMDNEWRNND